MEKFPMRMVSSQSCDKACSRRNKVFDSADVRYIKLIVLMLYLLVTTAESICPAGQYNDASLGCQDCPIGNYCQGDDTKQICNAGYVAISVAQESCTECNKGQYSLTDRSACQDCIENTYSDSPTDSCTPCPSGEFSKAGSSSCKAVCGDGKQAATEQCDDSNTSNSDGCNSECQVEYGYECNGGTPTTPSTCIFKCGDSIKMDGEACDDGNTNSNDGCPSDCSAIEVGYQCSGGNTTTADTCSPICGDGRKIGGEACDDGNTEKKDGCNRGCNINFGWACEHGTASNPDTCYRVCGDGFHIQGEACDDGNVVGDDGCESDCNSVTPGWICWWQGKHIPNY